MASRITLQELFEKSLHDSKRVLIVKNLPESVSQDGIENYIEVVTGRLLEAYCATSVIGEANIIIVAQLDEDIKDVTEIKDKPFEGRQVHFEHLGVVGGVVVSDVGALIQDTIELYFDNSKRSGGKEETVTSVKFHQIEEKTSAFVSICDKKATASILSRLEHKIGSQVMVIEPYFPAYHDDLVHVIKQSSRKRSGQSKDEKSHMDPGHISTTRNEPLNVEVNSKSEGSNFKAPSHIKVIEDVSFTKPKDKYLPSVTRKKEESTTTFTQRGPDTKTLQISFDGEESEITSNDDIPSDNYNTKEGQYMKHGKGADVYNRSNKRASEGRVINNVSASSDKKRSNRNTNVKTEKCLEDKIGMSKTKIVLLKIGCFQRKCKENQIEVEIILQETENTVTLKCETQEHLKEAKLQMYDLLAHVIHKSTKVCSEERAEYLARPSIQNFLRNQAKSKRIGAVYEVNVGCQELMCYAYHEETLDKGLELVKELFVTQTIPLRRGQRRVLSSKEWADCRSKNGTDLILIYETNESIIIETIFTIKHHVIRGIRSNITDFLKGCTPKEQAQIEVNGGQAEYFQKYCQKHLEDRLRQRGVQLRISRMKESQPMSLHVTVEGEPGCINQVKKEIDAIWHEDIDFQRITSEDGNIWLIMRSMDGDIGKKFFRQFQLDLKCIVQVVKDGEIRPPHARITQHTNNESELTYRTDSNDKEIQEHLPRRKRGHRIATDDEDTDDELSRFKESEEMYSPYTGRIEDFEDTSRPVDSIRRHIYSKYQAGMREEEAIAMAMAVSLSIDQPQPLDSQKNESDFDVNELMLNRTRHGSPHRLKWMQTRSPTETRIKPVRIAKTNAVEIGNSRIVLTQGQITEQKADVLVNIVDPSGAFKGQSVVSKAFLNTAGDELAMLYGNEANLEGYKYIRITKSTQRLECSHVIHIRLVKEDPQVLPVVMREIFEACYSNGWTSIAMPPLGVGRLYQYPAKDVATGMLQETLRQIHQTQHQVYPMLEVKIVVFGKDADTFEAFDTVFNQNKTLYWQDGSIAPLSTTQALNRPMAISSHVQPSMQMFSPARMNNPFNPSHRGQAIQRSKNTYQARPNIDKEARIPYSRSSQDLGLSESRCVEPKINSPTGSRYGFQRRQLETRDKPRLHHQPDSVFREKRSKSVGRQQNVQPYGKQAVDYDFFSLNMSGRTERGGGREGKVSRERGRRPRSRERQMPVHEGEHQSRENTYKENKYKAKASRQSRFSENSPSARLRLTVFAGNKGACEKACSSLAKRIKEEFLHQVDLEKRPHVSRDAKQKIVKVIETNKVKSIKANGKYTLIGYKEKVLSANQEILRVLLNDKPADPNYERKRQRSKVERATVKFAEVMVRDEIEVPGYWQNFKPGEILKNIVVDLKHLLMKRKFEKVVLDTKDHVYTSIVHLINETFRTDSDKIGQGKDAIGIQSFRKLYIHKICRIENPELYGEYASRRCELFKKLLKKNIGHFPKLERVKGGENQPRTSVIKDKKLQSDMYGEVNECYFFHGTKRENINKICSDGLDSRLCSGDAMFGRGIYGAESVVKADQYTDIKGNRDTGKKKMFLMRMQLGDIYVCTDRNPHKYIRPPCTSCFKDDCREGKHNFNFDSVVGGTGKLFREFVVYDSRQCYPEYVITYERR